MHRRSGTAGSLTTELPDLSTLTLAEVADSILAGEPAARAILRRVAPRSGTLLVASSFNSAI